VSLEFLFSISLEAGMYSLCAAFATRQTVLQRTILRTCRYTRKLLCLSFTCMWTGFALFLVFAEILP
jgi:hypothetical protein